MIYYYALARALQLGGGGAERIGGTQTEKITIFISTCKRNQFVKLKLLPILKTNVFELYVHRQVKTVLQIVKR